MAVSLEALGIDRMSLDDKLELVHAIWDRISTDADQAPISDALRRHLTERSAAYRQNPKAGSPWPEVKARLLGES